MEPVFHCCILTLFREFAETSNPPGYDDPDTETNRMVIEAGEKCIKYSVKIKHVDGHSSLGTKSTFCHNCLSSFFFFLVDFASQDHPFKENFYWTSCQH